MHTDINAGAWENSIKYTYILPRSPNSVHMTVLTDYAVCGYTPVNDSTRICMRMGVNSEVLHLEYYAHKHAHLNANSKIYGVYLGAVYSFIIFQAA